MTKILVVDDERSLRETLAIALEDDGHKVVIADSAEQALALFEKQDIDVVLTDLRMPGLSGVELLRHIKNADSTTEVILMTAFGSTDIAVDAMKVGAYDYLTKPFNLDEVKVIARRACERRAMAIENLRLRARVQAGNQDKILIKESPAMKEIYALLERVADKDVTVLITGESGVGKEVVAQEIHEMDGSRSGHFVAINCGALPENLVEAELFGYEKGAFTGADAPRAGLLEQANGGTIFLDEIGDLPLPAQVKLLRVIQEQTVRRLGASKERSLQLRFVAATNRSLEKDVQAGTFREDLFYRINVFRLEIPPLRQRREDIPVLFSLFCERAARRIGLPEMEITDDVFKLLEKYTFPGNVRELENIAERAVILSQSGTVSTEVIPPELRRTDSRPVGVEPGDWEIPDGFELDAWLEELEKKYFELALDKAQGVKKQAAELLGLSFRQFRYKAKKFGL